jgi:hypothetical protein
MDKLKRLTTSAVGEATEKLKFSYTASEKIKW